MAEEHDGAPPQEDINDKLLLDLAWEKQQKKTFAAWCNSHLRKVGIQIKDVDQDFRDGLALLRLLEIISGDKLSVAERKGKMRIHKIANVGKALAFIGEKGVKLAGIGAEEIVDGNLKMTLGMIWTIILRFAIQDISVEELSAKEGLLLWCQRKTAPYKNCNVQNFHISFKDGLAFCALIHRHRPDLIDYDSLKKGNDLYNLNLAFEVAEKHLDIPKMLDAEDIHSTVKPDERAIMTYVSSYYHAFSSHQQSELAAKRIGKVLNVNQQNEQLMEEYEQMASTLLDWIHQTLPWLNDRSSETTLDAAQHRLEEFRQYATGTKPPKVEEKGRLEMHFHTLQTKLRLSSRPAYVPSEGKLVNDINAAWRELEGAEKTYQEFLLSELRRLQRLELLAQKFEHKASKLDAWNTGKDQPLIRTDDIDQANLAEVMALEKQHDTFNSELAAQEARLSQLSVIANELRDLKYSKADAIDSRIESIGQSLASLKQLSADRNARINDAIAKQQKLDSLRLEFGKKAATFNNWMDNTIDDLHDQFSCSTIADVEKLQAQFEVFKSGELQNASTQYTEVANLVTEMAALGSTDNPYTALTAEYIYEKWCSILDQVPKRSDTYLDELNKQQRHEQLRIVFAEKANMVGAYIENKSSALADLSMNGKGASMEDQLKALKDFQAELLANQPQIEEAEGANQAIEGALIFDNPHTIYSMEGIRSSWAQLLTAAGRAINETENQILIRDSKGLSEDQIREYRASFSHFDKDNSGKLDKNEFRACLLSLSYKLGSDPTDDPVFEKIWQDLNPTDAVITFEQFLNFMTKEMVDRDTAEQVMNSFKVLAGDKPYITADTLKRELPADQAEYCIKRMAQYTGPGAVDGALDYQSFSSALYGQSEL
ncbi:hypothetical protein EMCRGX_G032073 [Ephydatia muelleri]